MIDKNLTTLQFLFLPDNTDFFVDDLQLLKMACKTVTLAGQND